VIPYGRQTVDEDDIEAVADALRSDFLTTGPRVAQFEADLAASTGATFVSVLSSGTAALHAAYAALGIGPGDEVVMPPLTFAATANAAIYLGAKPVFADVDKETGLVDPEAVAAAITPRTKAVIGVDYGGLPADYAAIRRSVTPADLPVIADAAQSLGASDGGRTVGTLADLTTLSFHPVKSITTGEGGAVATDREAWHTRVADFRTHGIVKNPDRQLEPGGPWHQEMHALGYNYRLTDFQAALGSSQLRKLDLFVERRRAIASRYNDAFAGTRSLQRPGQRPGAASSWHLYVVRVLDRDQREPLFKRLRQAGLGVQVHHVPVYRHPYYRERRIVGNCPVAEDFYERAISIPIFPAMRDSDVDRVIETIETALTQL